MSSENQHIRKFKYSLNTIKTEFIYLYQLIYIYIYIYMLKSGSYIN